MATYPEEVRRQERAALRKRRRSGPAGMSTLRVAELNRLFTDRYRGMLLPDDDSGRADIRLMVHHISRRHAAPEPHIEAWLADRAPWFTGEEKETLLDAAIAHPLKFKADTLGGHLRLITEERSRLRIRTIGPIDSTAAERAEARRIAGIERKRAERRAAGIGPLVEPAGGSINSQAPWKTEGISRSTWFRRRAEQSGETATPQ
ncbi:MAG TPA: hypothetical protein VIQ05_23200 [Tardiphaga sp.]